METPRNVLLPTAYFPPVSYFASLFSSNHALIEACETFPKQTYRNRCEILTSSGRQNLVVPVSKPYGNHTLTRDVLISYREPWHQHHWKSITTAYRSSPYFYYYADLLHPLFNRMESSLLIHNQNILIALIKILGIRPEISLTVDYSKIADGCNDLRTTMKPGRKEPGIFPEYPQVFSHLTGFIPDLSILDLIFNLGPASGDYLNKVVITP